MCPDKSSFTAKAVGAQKELCVSGTLLVLSDGRCFV